MDEIFQFSIRFSRNRGRDTGGQQPRHLSILYQILTRTGQTHRTTQSDFQFSIRFSPGLLSPSAACRIVSFNSLSDSHFSYITLPALPPAIFQFSIRFSPRSTGRLGSILYVTFNSLSDSHLSSILLGPLP